MQEAWLTPAGDKQTNTRLSLSLFLSLSFERQRHKVRQTPTWYFTCTQVKH